MTLTSHSSLRQIGRGPLFLVIVLFDPPPPLSRQFANCMLYLYPETKDEIEVWQGGGLNNKTIAERLGLLPLFLYPTGCRTSPPPPHTRGKAGRNHLNKEINPFLPTGIGERYSQTISNLRHAAPLRRRELPQ
jgi:hypothetical protein